MEAVGFRVLDDVFGFGEGAEAEGGGGLVAFPGGDVGWFLVRGVVRVVFLDVGGDLAGVVAVFAVEPVDEVPSEVPPEAEVLEDDGGAAFVFGGFGVFEVFEEEFEFGDVFGDGGVVLAQDVIGVVSG